MPRGVGLCRGFVSSLLSVQWGFSQLVEKLAFSPQTVIPLGIWASVCLTWVLQVVPRPQSHTARAVRLSSVSTADLKKPQLANAAKVTGWRAARPCVCFICGTVRHLNVAVNNLARVLGGKYEGSWEPLHYLKSNISPLCHPSLSRSQNRVDDPWASLLLGVLRQLTQLTGSMGGFPDLAEIWARSVRLCLG